MTYPNAIGHFGVNVPNLDQAVRFFEEALGFELVEQHALEVTDVAEAAWFGLSSPLKVRFAFLRLGNDDALLELVQWEVQGACDVVPDLTHAGGHHLALWTDDLDSAVQRLSSRQDILMFVLRVEWFAFFRTSWGLHVQLMQR